MLAEAFDFSVRVSSAVKIPVISRAGRTNKEKGTFFHL